jgi:small subunit ribosomal protein S9
MTPTKKTATATKAKAKEAAPKTDLKAKGNYHYALGRRKEASAQARLFLKGKGEVTVNGKPIEKYFTTFEQRALVLEPLVAVGQDKSLDLDLRIEGGGLKGQADAARLGVSRALLKLDPGYRTTLKPLGLLTRDARVKERKKPGLKKARRAPQWAKR